jgi:hypothetical protein
MSNWLSCAIFVTSLAVSSTAVRAFCPAVAEPAKKEEIQVADGTPKKPAAQATKVIGTCKIDDPNLVCDIAANPRRASLQDPLISISVLADNPNSRSKYKDYNLPLNSMKETARNGWVGDYFVGTYASRGIPRVRFQEDANEENLKDEKGNPIIELDLVQNLAAAIVGSALSTPDAKVYEFGPSITPLQINKTRICIAAHADVMMRMDKFLGITNLTTEQKDVLAKNPDIYAKIVTDALKQEADTGRAAKNDTKLADDVKKHLANTSTGKTLKDVVDDCGELGLRQLADEGFRYQGQCLVTKTRAP